MMISSFFLLLDVAGLPQKEVLARVSLQLAPFHRRRQQQQQQRQLLGTSLRRHR